MPRKRTRSRSTQTWGRKRAKKYGRGWRKSIGRAPSRIIHNFKRTFQLANYDPVGAGVQYRALSFKLSDLPNYTEFTTLFDVYAIRKVVCKFFYDLDGVVDAGRGCGYALSLLSFF